MNTLEDRARELAAIKMGLVNDPLGKKLPEDLWTQMLCIECSMEIKDFMSEYCDVCEAYLDHQR